MRKIKSCLLSIIIFSILSNNALAEYDKRGKARYLVSLESGFDYGTFNINQKGFVFDTPATFDISWQDYILQKNQINLNVPLFKIGNGDLIMQAYIAQAASISGDYQTSIILPGDSNYSSFTIYSVVSDVEIESYEGNINLAYQFPLTPNERYHSYYLFGKEVNSFLLPKIGFNFLNQEHSFSSSYNNETVVEYTNSFQSTWKSPFLGIESVNYIGNKHRMELSANYHYLMYDVEADIGHSQAYVDSYPTLFSVFSDDELNNITLKSQDSMNGSSTGHGFTLGFKYGYTPGKNISYTIGAKYMDFQVSGGDLNYNYKDNSVEKDILNEAQIKSIFTFVGISYSF